WFLARNAACHELEDAFLVDRTLHRSYPDSMMAHRYEHPFAHLEKLHGAGRVFFGIDGDSTIHRHWLRFQPFALIVHERWMIRADIKSRRKDAVRRRGLQL